MVRLATANPSRVSIHTTKMTRVGAEVDPVKISSRLWSIVVKNLVDVYHAAWARVEGSQISEH